MANSLSASSRVRQSNVVPLLSIVTLLLSSCSDQTTIQSTESDAESSVRTESSASPTAIESVTTEDTLSEDTEAASRFSEVKTILSESCSSCHSFPGFTREQDFVDYQYVVAGDPTSSNLYKYLKGTGYESEGLSSMPRSGSISAEDVATIQNWIELMGSESLDSDESDAESNDEDNSGPSASERRSSALTVLTNHCASCHSSGTQTATSASHKGATVKAFTSYTSDNQFVSAGLVSVGSSEDSWIYQALQSFGTIGSMPKSQASLSETEAKAISDWIDQMNEP